MDVRQDMDDKDYVEAGLTGSVGVGFSAGGADGAVAGSGTAKSTKARRFTRKGSEERNTNAASAKLAVGMSLPGQGFNGKVVVEAGVESSKPKGHVLIELNRVADVAEFMKQVGEGKMGELLIDWVGSAASTVRSLVLGTMDPSVGGSLSLGGALQLMGSAPLVVQTGGAVLARQASERFTGFGASLAQRLQIKLFWKGDSLALDVNLDRVSTTLIGKDLRAAQLTVVIESVSRMLNIPRVTLA